MNVLGPVSRTRFSMITSDSALALSAWLPPTGSRGRRAKAARTLVYAPAPGLKKTACSTLDDRAVSRHQPASDALRAFTFTPRGRLNDMDVCAVAPGVRLRRYCLPPRLMPASAPARRWSRRSAKPPRFLSVSVRPLALARPLGDTWRPRYMGPVTGLSGARGGRAGGGGRFLPHGSSYPMGSSPVYTSRP